MDIVTKISTEAITRSPPVRPLEKTRETASDSANFHQSAVLNQALRDEKDVREAKIERALNLVGQTNWPPQAVIRSLATLLAMHLSRAVEPPPEPGEAPSG